MISNISPMYANPVSNSPESSASSDQPPERMPDAPRRQYFNIPDVDELQVFPLQDLHFQAPESMQNAPSLAPSIFNQTDRTWFLDVFGGEQRVQMSGTHGSAQHSILFTFLVFFMLFSHHYFYISSQQQLKSIPFECRSFNGFKHL